MRSIPRKLLALTVVSLAACNAILDNQPATWDGTTAESGATNGAAPASGGKNAGGGGSASGSSAQTEGGTGGADDSEPIGGTGGRAGSPTQGGTSQAGAEQGGSNDAGSAGSPPDIQEATFVVDNVRLRRKQSPPGPNGFTQTFDADVGGAILHANGFSPGPGGSEGPPIFAATTLFHALTAGSPGGALEVTVPFTVKMQQADVALRMDISPALNLTGYELLADVKALDLGETGACTGAWLYAWGASGYAIDESAEPAMGQPASLPNGSWTTLSLSFDGPYGYYTTSNFPNYQPTAVTQLGILFHTRGCP